MQSDETLPQDQADLGELTGGASSTEDFWMFFSFAMILLVFVLMNYVNYLNAQVVKAPDERKPPPPADTTDADGGQAEPEFHIVVTPAPEGEGMVYTLAEDKAKTEMNRLELCAMLAERLADLEAGKPTKVYVHAPGNVLYQSVFNASYAAWEISQERPELQVSVHLVFEEKP